MSKATVELDFLGLQRQGIANHRPVDQRGSLRGMQGAISKLNPQLLRSVFASSPSVKLPEPAAFPQAWAAPLAPLPVLSAASRSSYESRPGTTPLTIFYNGIVTVFDLPHDKAEAVIKLAEECNPAQPYQEECLLEKLNAGGDLPIARKKSLQRFLEKRKERLTSTAPYMSEVVGLGSTDKANY